MNAQQYQIIYTKTKPVSSQHSTAKLWDDEHISKGMLEGHLDPELESATRTLGFVEKSVKWISKVNPVNMYPRLLDLGCGPGDLCRTVQ